MESHHLMHVRVRLLCAVDSGDRAATLRAIQCVHISLPTVAILTWVPVGTPRHPASDFDSEEQQVERHRLEVPPPP